jgi:hypothetical protein
LLAQEAVRLLVQALAAEAAVGLESAMSALATSLLRTLLAEMAAMGPAAML